MFVTLNSVLFNPFDKEFPICLIYSINYLYPSKIKKKNSHFPLTSTETKRIYIRLIKDSVLKSLMYVNHICHYECYTGYRNL
jgi:hypothetical protein